MIVLLIEYGYNKTRFDGAFLIVPRIFEFEDFI